MNELWKAAGAAAWGAAGLDGLQPYLRPQAWEAIQALCPGARSVWTAAFPYYAGDGPGNLSLYCRGEDYHRVLGRRLEEVCAALTAAFPENRFVPGADNSPIPELAAAELAGVGFRGRHGLRIVPPYGSYVFLGTVLTDLPCSLPKASPAGQCPPDCTACRRACPTGALGPAGVDAQKCLSAWTQEKGELPPQIQAQIKNSPTVWGCDLCQRACPWNRQAACSPLPEFTQELLPELSLAELEGLSGRAFRRRYGDRAFAWRGLAPLLRNLKLREE